MHVAEVAAVVHGSHRYRRRVESFAAVLVVLVAWQTQVVLRDNEVAVTLCF